MIIITPNKKFVKRKIEVKEKPPVCQRIVNEQEGIKKGYKKMKAMNIIAPELEFVNRKISEVGKKTLLLALCCQLSKPVNREDFPTSFEYNLAGVRKKRYREILTSLEGSPGGFSWRDFLEGKNASLGSRKLGFGGGGDG